MAKKTTKTESNFQVSENGLFAFIKKDKKINICLGGYKVCRKTFDTYKQAEEYLATKPWEIIINAAALFNHKQQEENENASKTKKDA